jgi:hypothetical protein
MVVIGPVVDESFGIRQALFGARDDCHCGPKRQQERCFSSKPYVDDFAVGAMDTLICFRQPLVELTLRVIDVFKSSAGKNEVLKNPIVRSTLPLVFAPECAGSYRPAADR